MRKPRKRRLAALVSIAVLLPAVGVAGTTAFAQTTASAQDSELDWQSCPKDEGTGMQCASIKVPVNWDRQNGRQITLELGRLPATGPGPSEGSVLVAYGGPGAPGIFLTKDNPDQWAKLRKRMDIVTWDTRGYGEQFHGTSTGLPCTWTRVPIAQVPADKAEFGRLTETNKANAYPCRSEDPEFFDHMSSEDQARDMEAIRKALGEDRLNFYGASYAGFYAQSYARLFPDRIRTMVLDGTWSHANADWDAELDASARRNEQAMKRFFDWCDADSSCALHGRDVERQWQRLVHQADRSPIPAPNADVHYDGTDLRYHGLNLAYDKEWARLAKAIWDGHDGDASRFVPEAGGPYPGLPTGITECLDWPRFTEYEGMTDTIDRLERIAPNAGAVGTMAMNTLQCAGWPTKVTNPPRPLPKDVPPLLGAGNWGEFDAVERVLDQVPGSRSIYHDDAGHTLYGFNACARDHINRYFADAVLPSPGTEC